MNFTLRQLVYFRALVQQRNFGRAAEACHVSQPALSVQIKAMEDEMGGMLVERQARDIVLTPLGREVLTHVEDVLATTERLAALARERAGGQQQLAIGLIPTIAPYVLPGVLAALRADDLSLSVRVREARTEQLTQALLAGELDAAVLALPVGVSGLAETALFEDRFLLAGSEARMSEFRAHTPDPGDLRAEHLMLLEDGHCLTDQALDVCGMDRSSSRIDTGASSLATLSRLVAGGFGLTLIPELAARAEAGSGLYLCRFSAPEPSRTIGLVRRATTPESGWFSSLADVIRIAGQEIVEESRNEIGPANGEPVSF